MRLGSLKSVNCHCSISYALLPHCILQLSARLTLYSFSAATRASSCAPAPASPSLLGRLIDRVRKFFGGIFGALFARWWSPGSPPLLPVASSPTTPLLSPAGPVSSDPSPSPFAPPPLVGLSFILAAAPPTPSMGGSANWPSTMATSAPMDIVRPTPRGRTWGMGDA